jgi:hypothetical protein
MQCGLSLSLFVDQPTISSISNDKVVNENDTATITRLVDSESGLSEHKTS